MKEPQVLYCRNCGAAMLSTDNRYRCEKCGYRYILIDREKKLILEPMSQKPRDEGGEGNDA